MRPVGPVEIPRLDEPQERLVHERRGLQRVAGTLVPHVFASHAVQLLVDERRQPIQRRSVAALPRLEQAGDFRRAFRIPHQTL
jgi:hypothetical protein